jgi:hypothetical protein
MSTEFAVLGADTANQQAGGPSFFDRAGMFTSTAVLSGLGSIYNTAVYFGNKVGMEADLLDTAKILETYDRDWYNYYKENEQLIDTAGFIATSFLPGTFALKGLKAAQAGMGAGAIGRSVSGTLNFANAQRTIQLEKGLAAMAAEGGSVHSYINANKLASMTWGYADNIIQAAAWESAVALTMHQSPLLADASVGGIMHDIAFGAFVGGTFGGVIDAISTNRVFKDAVKQLGGIQRKYDTPTLYPFMTAGDEAYGMIDSVLAMKGGVDEADKLMPFKYTVGGKTKAVELNIAAHLDNTLTKTEQKLYQDIQLTLSKLGGANDTEAGAAVAENVLATIRKGKADGLSAETIREQVGNLTLGLKKVRSLTDDAPLDITDGERLFYVADKVDLKALEAGGNTVESLMKLSHSRTPFAKNATSKPWQVVGDVADAKMAPFGFMSFAAAWEQGYDIAIIGGKLRYSPKSEIFKQVKDGGGHARDSRWRAGR